MLNENELEGLDRELSDFRLANSKHHDSLQELTDNYSQLLEDYRRLRSDYEEEKESREKYKKLARGQERNPFVLVLVDGDGYIFDDALITAGAEGGVKAANLLNAAIKDRLIRLGHDVADARIMVRIYTNLAGLSKALARAGLSGNEARSLAPFCASFTRARDLFDFVDAGDKKENADFKIREMFRLFADNSQCKHIFFAGCHDNGYLSMLTPHIGKSDRISLIRGAYVHQDFLNLQLRMEDFPGVFRSYPLEGYNSAYRPTPPISKSSNHSIPSHSNHSQHHYNDPSPPPSTSGKICTHYLKGMCKYGSGCRNIHVTSDSWRNSGTNGQQKSPPQGPSLFGRLSSALDFSAADAQNSNFNPPQGLPASALLPRLTAENENMIPLNQDGNRLDFYLKPPTAEQWNAYTQRAKIHKMCNDYQLTGHCNNGLQCHYDHSPLEPHLKHVLKLIVHDYPCGRRGACRVKGCNLGHICYREGCHGSNGKGGCRLNRSMHGIDPNVADWVPAVQPSANGWSNNGSSAGEADDLSSGTTDTDDSVSERGGAEFDSHPPSVSNGATSLCCEELD
ncbi:hypothetical protein BDV97DRAFT_4773 [Delphinella strobiligena]|nr:hypothetical protein BDV97DRAFT_4773 [Delphinella strobiligena]